MKILILKPSSLGDVIQAIPVLRLLRRAFPDGEIYWWIDTALAPLLIDDPDLTGVVPFDRRRWASPQNWNELWSAVRWCREKSFDWVIDLQCLARSAFFAWFANGQLTVGLDQMREGTRGFYDILVPRASFHTHAVDWYLAILPVLEVPVTWNFKWLPERPLIAAQIRQKWQVGASRWIALQPGARWLNKRWPRENFATLVHLAARQHPEYRFAILGSKEDMSLGEFISRTLPDRCLDLTGQLSLLEMVEWLRVCEIMVTNDTGPMHVGAALGKPMVALFGPTEPRRTGPYGQLEKVLRLELPCAPCLSSRCAYVNPLECLNALPVSTVLQALGERLAG